MNVRAGVTLAAGLAMILAAAAGCHSYPPPKPLDQLTPQEARGHAVFQAQCAQCHYDRRDAALHGPPLVSLYKKQYLASGAPANDERVSSAVLHGRGMMPALGNKVDQQDLDDLLAYLHTL